MEENLFQKPKEPARASVSKTTTVKPKSIKGRIQEKFSESKLVSAKPQPQTPEVVSENNGQDEKPQSLVRERLAMKDKALFTAYSKIGQLDLSKEEKKALTERIPDADVEIRPDDGQVYIPHMVIRDRLTTVLGAGEWSLVRMHQWVTEGMTKMGKPKFTVFAECFLVIRGIGVGEAVGSHDYYPSNDKTNFDDALESAESQALRRIAAKKLGVGSQVWLPSYKEYWLDQYADKNEKGDWIKVTKKHQQGD